MKPQKPNRFVAEVNAHPLKIPLFIELMSIAQEALTGKSRFLPPNAERCLEDAPANTLYLADIPENQMGMTIVNECMQRFPEEEGHFTSQSFLFRWFAIQKAQHDGKLDEFVRNDGKQVMVHSAVFEAGAVCPLDAEGDFDSTYLDRVRKIFERENQE